jgi:hypothetical protein
MATRLVCSTRSLSPAQRASANSIAASLGLREGEADGSMSPSRRLIEARRETTGGISPAVIAVVKASYWGKRGAALTTGFMDNPSRDLRREILRHLNMWSTRSNVRFVESAVDPTVRIDRRSGQTWGGYWSYVGTDVLGVDKDEPTMNLEGFTMRTSPSEFRRVVCHEAGHTLGFPHEHMRKELVQRIDPAKAYPYFQMTDGWSRQDVDDQVLSPLHQRTIIGTPVDQTSIMCYQLPGSITRDGKPILGGTRINETDYRFAAVIYPLPQRATGGARGKRGAKKSGPRKKPTRRKSTRRVVDKKRAAKKRTPKRRATKRTKATKRGRD